LKQRLENDYIVIKTSFEGNGEAIFETEEIFCRNILSQLYDGVLPKNDNFKNNIINENNKENKTLVDISKAITRIIQKEEKNKSGGCQRKRLRAPCIKYL
jgi:hypothetical protein